MERLGLTGREDSRVDRLSHGNQQRVQLAVALVHDPDLLVLDEPFAGLDPIAVDALAALLHELSEAGTAVLFSSHQLVGSLASRAEDAQAAVSQVIALLAGIYVAAAAAVSRPSAGWVTLSSMLPPTAPIFMPLRTSRVPSRPGRWWPQWSSCSPPPTACCAPAPGCTATRYCTPGPAAHQRAWHGELARPQPAQR